MNANQLTSVYTQLFPIANLIFKISQKRDLFFLYRSIEIIFKQCFNHQFRFYTEIEFQIRKTNVKFYKK
jgi:hypothetical protein